MAPVSSWPDEFALSYDVPTKIISAVVCGVLAFAALASQNILVACVGLLVIAVSYAYSPRGYLVSARTITVRRLVGNAVLALEAVRDVRPATKDDFRGCLRLWGNGGLFGYYGLFRTSKLGKCTWYVTNRRKAVIVVTEAKTVLFSPDDVNGFLTAIRASTPIQPSGAAELTQTLQASGGVSSVATWTGVAVGIVALALVAFVVSYSPGPPNYTLTPESLVIRDRFYPVTLQRAAVDAGGIRIVDLAAEPAWRPVSRTNGFSNSHYHAGWFRLANGQKARMYRAGSRQLVLLPPKGDAAPVLLEAKEPDRFLAEIRREWSAPN